MIAFPFDSRIVSYDVDGMPIYDRASNAEHFAKLLASFLRNGLFGSEMCEVLIADGMNVTVGKGNALIEGRFAYLDTPETLTFAPSEGNPRIDTVVLRRDLSSDVNYIVADIVKGTAAASPGRPALTRDGTVWELGLADVLIPANSTAVSQTNITDTRLEDSRCGLVAAILTDVDTTYLYAQIQADLKQFQDVEEENFRIWFESIQGILEGDAAANLANEVNKKAETRNQQVTIPVSGWEGTSPYTQDIVVVGATANKDMCSIFMSDDPEYEEQFESCTPKMIAQKDGAVTFRVDSIPDEAFPVNVMVVLQGVSEG